MADNTSQSPVLQRQESVAMESLSVTKQDLADLMKKSKLKGAQEIASKYGDVEGLVRGLSSNSKVGLTGNEEVSSLLHSSILISVIHFCVCYRISDIGG